MHQPWASYLISGIKVHEGRNWYSPHRGRLWIHAAAKEPSDADIAAVQQMYLNRSSKIEFPKNLPISCLLGCVDVTDVLAQEEYRDRYPKGESSSPFVFVCQNPQELMIKFPMTGQHKICKFVLLLDHDLPPSFLFLFSHRQAGFQHTQRCEAFRKKVA